METKKTHLTHKLSVKLAVFFLFLVFTLLALAGAFGVCTGLEDGWYSYRPNSFYTSELTRSMVFRNLNQIAWSARNGDVLTPADGCVNLLYAVYDQDGRNVAQNCDGDSAVYIGESEFWWSDTEFYQIRFWLRAPLQPGDGYYDGAQLYGWAYANRTGILIATLGLTVLAVICAVLLLCGAGRKEGVDGVCLAWVNRKIPFDLYLFAGFWVCLGLGAAAVVSISDLVFGGRLGLWVLGVILAVLAAAAFATVFMHLLICFAARVKGGAWWRNTLIYMVLHWCWRMLKKLFGKLKLVLRSLPLVWKSVLVFCGAALVNIILAFLTVETGPFWLLVLLLFDSALLVGVALTAMQLRKLQAGGEALARGDLNAKVDPAGMYWEFRRHAENLNSISDGMTRAVEARMKSEHFKTELITNVSHDIKTPLTSIINYVDLLKKDQVSGDKAAEYLEVLERQSARLKKLTEDLVEASKASSGAMHVELSRSDVCELLRQAAGEYEDRFAAAQVTPVITAPEHPVDILCDGRLLWRVFDNLLGNICKYSQPGTRAYMSVDEDGDRVWLMVKNISRDILNVSADELMERFVRGDRSRSTEGSGLGLSIARSLTELQGGTFRLFVDGDLFKVILTFAKAA